MKLIQAAGVTLAGMVLLGGVAFQGPSSQVNPPDVTPGTTAATSSTVGTGTSSSNPVGSATQAKGQFNFASDQPPITNLQLGPDQTVATWVRIVFEKKSQTDTCKAQTNTATTNNKPENRANTNTTSNKTSKNTASKKANTNVASKTKKGNNNVSRKKGGTNNTGQGTNGTQNDAKDKIADTDKKCDADVPMSLNFSLEITPTDFSPCVASVKTLVTDRSWKLDDPPQLQGIPISITSCSPNGGQGNLIIVGSSGQRRTLQVTLNARRSGSLSWAMIASLVVAVFLSLVCAAIVIRHGHKMNDRIGQASWDFSSSWASNITAFGTGITFILNLSAFPDKPFFGTRLEYSLVAAFATALVALAPGIHRMMSVTGVGGPTPATEGLVGGFLAASTFTMWGALLQTGLELLIIWELVKSITIYCSIGLVVGIAVGLTAIGLVVYSITTILFTIGGNAARSGTPPAQPLAAFSAAAPTKQNAITRPISVL